MEQNYRQQIIDFITTNFLFDADSSNVGEEDSLLESGVIDSTGVIELVAFVEQTYGIVVEDEEIVPENLDSVANIVHYLERKLNGERANGQA